MQEQGCQAVSYESVSITTVIEFLFLSSMIIFGLCAAGKVCSMSVCIGRIFVFTINL